jgi:hypothetical protein
MSVGQKSRENANRDKQRLREEVKRMLKLEGGSECVRTRGPRGDHTTHTTEENTAHTPPHGRLIIMGGVWMVFLVGIRKTLALTSQYTCALRTFSSHFCLLSICLQIV